ncbi:hypothetical protein [Streptomyces johnsoniae]|uniref:Uncharacterized protein n=1 Tax=Streptomyces johnsoniae TaxID=3075532 RepID=A0ABU2S003_9ACTN|nr:hypothetical protein [Streptomyces sp. DSM 41886]MDT0442341.1 hypothetical protein [Streptomyces sp. DSM 41886]
MISGDPEEQTPCGPFSQSEMKILRELQRLLDEAYGHYFAFGDGYCKSSEGYMGLHFNNYFDRQDGEPLRIKGVDVYSYVLGPHRMHNFKSLSEALEAVRKWHAREMASDSEETW